MAKSVDYKYTSKILNELDPLLYSEILQIIKPEGLPPQDRESLIIKSENNGSVPSFLIAYRNSVRQLPFYKSVRAGIDAYLVINDIKDTIPLLNSFPEVDICIVSLFNDDCIQLLKLQMDIEDAGSQRLLHARASDLCNPYEYRNDVVMLTKEHDHLVQKFNSENIRNNWQFTMENDCASFGVINGDRILSMCTVDFIHRGSEYFGEVLHIETESEFRGRGLGRDILYSATKYILDNGASAYYHVFDYNDASYNMAKSVGYKDHGRVYSFWASKRN